MKLSLTGALREHVELLYTQKGIHLTVKEYSSSQTAHQSSTLKPNAINKLHAVSKA